MNNSMKIHSVNAILENKHPHKAILSPICGVLFLNCPNILISIAFIFSKLVCLLDGSIPRSLQTFVTIPFQTLSLLNLKMLISLRIDPFEHFILVFFFKYVLILLV